MKRGRWAWTVALVAGILTIDVWSKWLIHADVPLMARSLPVYPYGGIGVFENFCGIEFSIAHATNTGTIWGLLGSAPKLLVLLRLAIIVMLIVYLVKRKRGWFPLVLILAGAIGNVLDFFFYGHVVDMFFFRFWGWDYPVFNVADSAICIGVFWLIARAMIGKGAARDDRRQHPSD